jgi:hypothetical protein
METTRDAKTRDGADAGRRNALKLTGLGLATLGMMPLFNMPFAKAQDMSNDANNFYASDKVNLQKVTFRNQYQTNIAGNLFTPKTLHRNQKAAAVIVGHPMEERPMADPSKERTQAEAAQRAPEGAQAMSEYNAERQAERAKSAQKALRLAKEAAENG